MMTDYRLGVSGAPVIHSKSPLLFHEMFSKTQITGSYIRLGIHSADEIKPCMDILNLDGLNITSPFKETIIPYLDYVDENARIVHAVNTVTCDHGRLSGYNTDIKGVYGAFNHRNFSLKDKKVVILGAGGASRAAALAAQQGNAADVVIINRTFEKGRWAAKMINGRAAPIEALRSELKNADILISCLPSDSNPVQPEWLSDRHIILDANYKNSVLNQSADQAGSAIISGLEWLVFQAMPAFEYFTGTAVDSGIKKHLFSQLTFEEKKHPSHIYLIGFMGTGKSSIGKLLARKLNMDFADMDALIEAREGKTIAQIFDQDGEAYFRKIEHIILSEISEKSPSVIATGGGIIENRRNRDLIKHSGTAIWLITPFQTLIQRTDPTNRPLWEQNKLHKIWSFRQPLYTETSDLVILNDDKPIEVVMDRILQEFT